MVVTQTTQWSGTLLSPPKERRIETSEMKDDLNMVYIWYDIYVLDDKLCFKKTDIPQFKLQAK